MGGAMSAVMCKLCGGRWRQGPRATLIMGASRRKTIARLTLDPEFTRPSAKARSGRAAGRSYPTTNEEPLLGSEMCPRRNRIRRAEVDAEMYFRGLTWKNHVEGWTTAED